MTRIGDPYFPTPPAEAQLTRAAGAQQLRGQRGDQYIRRHPASLKIPGSDATRMHQLALMARRDMDPTVRIDTVQQFATVQNLPHDILEILIDSFTAEPSIDVRIAHLDLLARHTESKRARLALAATSQHDPACEVRQHAAKVLHDTSMVVLGNLASNRHLHYSPEHGVAMDRTDDVLGLWGLHEDDENIRLNAITELGRRESTRCLNDLHTALHDPAWKIRHAIVCALGRIADPSSLPHLRECLLHDDNDEVRFLAARAIRMLQRRQTEVAVANTAFDEALRTLTSELPDLIASTTDPMLQGACIILFGLTGRERAIETLTWGLNEIPQASNMSAALLLHIGTPAACLALIRTIDEGRNAWAREAAQFQLSALAGLS